MNVILIICCIIGFVGFILFLEYAIANYHATQVIQHVMSIEDKAMREKVIQSELRILRSNDSHLNYFIADIIEYKFNKYKERNV
jgi:hypothetical protein